MSILNDAFNPFGFAILETGDPTTHNLNWMLNRYKQYRIGNTGHNHEQAINDVLTGDGPHLGDPNLVTLFSKAAEALKGHNYFPEF